MQDYEGCKEQAHPAELFSGFPRSTNLPYVESQRDGVIKIGIGTSCKNPEMPQNREQQGAGNEHTWQDKDVPKDCKRKKKKLLTLCIIELPCSYNKQGHFSYLWWGEAFANTRFSPTVKLLQFGQFPGKLL